MIMKKLFVVLGIIVMVAFTFTQARAAIVINFDTLADNTLVTNQYANLGVIFNNAYGENDVFASPFSYPTWLAGELGDGYNGIGNMPISGYFVDPSNSSIMATTDSISANIVYPDGSTASHLQVFDLNNNLIASSTSTSGLLLGLAQGGIHSFTYYWTGGGSSGNGISFDDVIGIDDLIFNEVGSQSGGNVIPEPATLSLLGLGLVGLLRFKRKK